MNAILWMTLALARTSFAADPPPAPPGIPAPAAPAATEPDPAERTGVAALAGVQVGGAFSIEALEAAFLPRLELGLELPWAQRRFRVTFLGSWTRPLAEGEDTDPRVPDGTWGWDLKQTEVLFALGPTVRIPEISERFVPEITVAPQIDLLRTQVNGEASGAPFGESVEEYTRMGFYAALGVATELGPGELNLQLAFSISQLDGVVTGDSSTAALAPLLGYRFVF